MSSTRPGSTQPGHGGSTSAATGSWRSSASTGSESEADAECSSLEALDHEYIGESGRGASWTRVTPKLLDKKLISPEDARRIRWLDVFGQLIGNTDRHFGNVSFLEQGDSTLRLAPAYDMLPMLFAPSGTTVAGLAVRARTAERGHPRRLGGRGPSRP